MQNSSIISDAVLFSEKEKLSVSLFNVLSIFDILGTISRQILCDTKYVKCMLLYDMQRNNMIGHGSGSRLQNYLPISVKYIKDSRQFCSIFKQIKLSCIWAYIRHMAGKPYVLCMLKYNFSAKVIRERFVQIKELRIIFMCHYNTNGSSADLKSVQSLFFFI